MGDEQDATADVPDPAKDEGGGEHAPLGLELDRRDWLRSLGAAALVGGASQSALSPAAAATADTSLSADERIRKHRTGDLGVIVENPDGSPVEGAQVSVSQQAHDFGWGTAVNADTLLNQTSEGDNYREYVTDLFNTAVLENRHKWRFFEEQQALADDATEWILDQGLDLRGHVCIWANRDAYAVPADVETALDEGDAETVRQRSMDHVETIIDHYGDQITEWEVVNEVVHEPAMIETVDGTDVNPVEAPILAAWYRQAEAVRPDGVSLAVNDYNALAGPYGYARSSYETQIQFLQDEGIDLSSAGMQCHFGQGETVGTDDVLGQLDAYGRYGLDLKITEFDMANDGWTESAKAEFFEEFLRAVFSHPAVTDFVLWGFWDGRHWQNDAPLFTRNWEPKPSHDVYTSLVFEEWWTDETGVTDTEGTYATSAFLGDYEITVVTDSGQRVREQSVTESNGTATVTVTIEGQGTGSDERAPSPPTDLSITARDPTSVGLEWVGATDAGGSGLEYYRVTLDGMQVQTVAAGTTRATVGDLSPETSYELGVSSVDSAGNQSAPATVTTTTAPRDDAGDGENDETPADALVINDYDGDPAWPDGNDLGNWNGAGSFENGGGSGEVVDGALALEYDSAGWFVEQVLQNVSDYTDLVVSVRGDHGGEETDFAVAFGGVSETLGSLASKSIGTSTTEVRIDMDAAGMNRNSPGELRLNFWQGDHSASTVYLNELRLE